MRHPMLAAGAMAALILLTSGCGKERKVGCYSSGGNLRLIRSGCGPDLDEVYVQESSSKYETWVKADEPRGASRWSSNGTAAVRPAPKWGYGLRNSFGAGLV